MKKYRSHGILLTLVLTLTVSTLTAASHSARQELQSWYQEACSQPSDIYEHVSVLKDLAEQCSSVVEIGVRDIVSTWGILYGLSLSSAPSRLYLGIDLEMPPQGRYDAAKRLAEANDVQFRFLQANDMTIDIEPVDMLFIDSLHTYCHLTYELEKFAPKVNKYITLHDTSYPWGEHNDYCYHGDYSEYPAHINRTKAGLWLAVQDFLRSHPEWTLLERRLNSHGFTILKRVAQATAD